MVYCVQAELLFATEARRDLVADAVETRIAGRARFAVDVVTRLPRTDEGFGLIVELRFTSRADQADLDSHVQSFATGARAPLPGSRIWIHDCSSSEATVPCVITSERTW